MQELVGIDVGGTFTDCVALSPDGEVHRAKVFSTPDDPSRGVLDGLRELARAQGVPFADYARRISRIVHGTTVATNAFLTGSGARVSLLTTRGFRDALEMREGIKEEQYDHRYRAPEPLVPRFLRIGVGERVNSDGQVLARVDPEEIDRALRTMRRHGVEAVAVSFMHAYANDANEREAGALLAAAAPDLHVTLSSQLLPQIRFYERTSTTAFNAYVSPVVGRYVVRLAQRLREAGIGGSLLVMQSSGGVVGPAAAVRRAAGALLSGPAAGPIAAAAHAAAHGDDCISVDMGGTSFDVGLVRDGRPSVVPDARFDRRVVALPSTDIHTIGAGGGSIAWIDRGGLLRMGPESAGADPGPACYGRGGERPTCTDANLVLGLIGEQGFLGGTVSLDRAAAAAAIERDVARPLGLSVTEAAAGMLRIIDVNMATGVRTVSLQRGIDPRAVPLVAGGGCGPLHAGRIAQELEVPLVIVPRAAGLLCATGMLLTDLRHDYIRTHLTRLDRASWPRLQELIDGLVAEGDAALEGEGVPADRRSFETSLDLRYAEQHREIEVPCVGVELTDGAAGALRTRFEAAHDARFGHTVPRAPVELVNVRVQALGLVPKLSLPTLPHAGPDPGAALRGTRRAYAGATGFQDVGVYDGAALGHGQRVVGPALVEEPTTTILVPPEFDMLCDAAGSYLLAHRSIAGDVAARLERAGAAA